MRYRKFVIENFKGIKHTEVDLASLTGANVFPLVGLNESGKTTILEAIHSFAPDYRSRSLTGGVPSDFEAAAAAQVPRHQIAKFSGGITVRAEVITSSAELAELKAYIPKEIIDVTLDVTEIPNTFTISRSHIFEKGDYIETVWETSFDLLVKTGKQRNFRTPTAHEKKYIIGAFRDFLPDIAYYPTFIFDFPEKIFLNYRIGESRSNSFYRAVIADILAYDGQGFELDDIIRRVRSEDYRVSWTSFFPLWMSGDDRDKVQHIVDRISAITTKVVFGRWNQIFGERIEGKEVIVSFDVEEGVALDPQKNRVPDTKHDVYVSFKIKDGTRRFNVEDRSLGFRWFFAFLLFTQFRVAKKARRPVLFLFDEPASNLHAAAQSKLIESFPEIARGDNMMLYSTHSHYMIDPAWLEQTFIVTNRTENPKETIFSSAVLDDTSLDIQATKYRRFVNDNPIKTSYFQPIIDRLEVVPSRFDYALPSIVVEGKSDYYILRYAEGLLKRQDLRFIPGLGAGTLASLVALSVGWGLRMVFLLDGDSAGEDAKEIYAIQHGAPRQALVTLSDLAPGITEIEDLLDEGALSIIRQQAQLDRKPTKNQIRRFFQEGLARNDYTELGDGFRAKGQALLNALDVKLASLSNP